MRFIDEVKIFTRSGDGGNGCVSFRREKFVPRGGPDGGDGGNGGSVVIVADSTRINLIDLKYNNRYIGKRGVHGKGSGKHGRNSEETLVHVPPGTLIKNPESGELIADLSEKGQKFIAAKGGRGGRGNTRFTSSTNKAPRRAEEGRSGTEKWYLLELKVIADVGIIGFPSVGKSTLIRALSNAKPKVAAYPFTTLSPHLGAIMTDEYRQVVFADIPGLIEGASEGLGLGHKFLRHIERTRMLIHMIDLAPDTDREAYDDYKKINIELKAYNKLLLEKPQVVVANKIDTDGADRVFEKLRKQFKKEGIEIFAISALKKKNIEKLLNQVLSKLDIMDGRIPGELTWEAP